MFVSSSLGDDEGPGTQARPVRTFERAIALAVAGPVRIHACAERFEEAVKLPSGVTVFGGLDCTRGWVYAGGVRTVVAPAPGLVPLRIETGEGLSTITDLRLEAADAVLPGASSIAMIVGTGAAAVLRSELLAGDGADGASGEAAAAQPAMAGMPGSDGAAACSADVVQGGPATSSQCDDGSTSGGRGGDGNSTFGGNGNDGQPEPIPNPADSGTGGNGQNAMSCAHGRGGQVGADGAHGSGARGTGKPTPEGWKGIPGQDGGKGLRGQGGGGGGGSRGGTLHCGLAGNTPKGGASGGSGGSGGCGGKGGKGGGYGGASIGLVSFGGDVSLTATSIVTGKGGDGGAGGLAQFGGVGGPQGVGGASVGGSQVGCQGGPGGQGGNGGYGGGGLGGPSIGIAYQNGHIATARHVTIDVGEPGKGGPGGNQALPDSAGADGIKAETLGFPQ